MPQSERVPLFSIRDAVTSDAPAVLALRIAAYAADVGPHRPPGVMLRDDIAAVRASFDEGALLVAARNDGALLGTVALRRSGELRRLAVDPALQRAGVGRALVAAAITRGAQEKWPPLFIDVLVAHPWLPRFYATVGFRDAGVVTRPDGSSWLRMTRRTLTH